MFQGAVEERRLGEHRDGRRTPLLVRRRNRDGVVVRPQHPARRRAPLTLCDDARQRDTVKSVAYRRVMKTVADKSGLETSRPHFSLLRPRGQRSQRLPLSTHLDDALRGGGDRGEEIGGGRRAHYVSAANSSAAETAIMRS